MNDDGTKREEDDTAKEQLLETSQIALGRQANQHPERQPCPKPHHEGGFIVSGSGIGGPGAGKLGSGGSGSLGGSGGLGPGSVGGSPGAGGGWSSALVQRGIIDDTDDIHKPQLDIVDICRPETQIREEIAMAAVQTAAVVKVEEFVGSSPTSFSDAVRNVVRRASQTLRNIRGVEVISSNAEVGSDGELTLYKVNCKVAFIVEDH